MMRRVLLVTSLAALTVTSAAAAGGQATVAPAAACRAHWTSRTGPLPPLPTRVPGPVLSLVVLSRSDVWALVGGYHAAVYHFGGTAWQGPFHPPGPIEALATTMAATSDSNVWVFGGRGSGAPPLAERFDGSVWMDESPTLPGPVYLTSAVIARNGDVYVAGSNTKTHTGLIWRFDGTRWADVTPATAAPQYNALALAGNGTLLAVGSKPGPVLQELSNGTWTTVSVPAPSASLTAVTTAPGGTVVAAGRDRTRPILVRQRPGAASATVLSAPPAPVHPSLATETGLVAVGPGNVWLLGQYFSDALPGWLPWVMDFDGTGFERASTPARGGTAGAILGGTRLGVQVLAFGNVAPEPGLPGLMGICPVQVSNTALAPRAAAAAIGTRTFWSVPVTDRGPHRLVSPGVFDSGTLRPGGSFGYTAFAAATYLVRDTATGARSTLAVPPRASPASGTSGTVFRIMVASVSAPVGYQYRVLVKRPGSDRYVLLKRTGQRAVSFVATRSGTYQFEAQLRTPVGVTAPSPPVSIRVFAYRTARPPA